MNKLFLTIALAFITTFASAQFVALTTFNEDADSTWNATDKIGIGYKMDEKLLLAVTKDGEDKYELVGRYDVHHGLWATCIYNYEKDSEEELKDKLELGLGYSYNIWNKIYIDLTPVINSGGSVFEVFLESIKPEDVNTTTLYIDNFRIIYL